MSHLVQAPGEKRVSLETVYVRPNQPLSLGVWGFIDGLRVEALGEDGKTTGFCKISTPAGAPKDRRQLTFSQEGFYRVELKMGDSMWDWLRVAATNKVPVSAGEYKAKGSGTLGVEVLWVKDGGTRKPLPHYVTVAAMLLQKHGYKLDIKGAESSAGRKLDFPDDIIVGVGGDNGNLGALGQALGKRSEYSKGDRLVVVVGPARENYDETKDRGLLAGQCVEKKDGATGKPFILINGNNASSDGATLLHEMCHAAGYHHGDKHGAEDNDQKNIMSYGQRRNLVHKDRIEDLQKAFFRRD